MEAASYASVTKAVVAQFIKKEIICQYGLLEIIISDNGLNLNNDMVTEVCIRFKIRHHNLIPYRPKMNGVVEAANKNMKKIIAKMTDIQGLAREVAFRITCLSDWGSDINRDNPIFIGLWNGGYFANRSENSVSTSS